MPMFRDLWENIRKDMPKKGRASGGELDPLKLPTRLQTALQALYGHYEKTFNLWREKGIKVPPCFIIVCQNTAISKLVYDFISGFHRKNDDGTTTLENGRLALFRNFDETTGNPLPRPNTLLIDSEQLEAGDALDDNFRGMAADEIERFHREIVERTGDVRAGDNITDQELLREVMNTVGKPGQLGGDIRCVVSVSMLTEATCAPRRSYQELADMACNYNPTGSTKHVRFNTSRADRWETSSKSCHINWVVLDSDWEAEFCRVAESHPKVRAYVKNHNLGLEVPYRYGSETRKYLPDFIVLVDDGHGPEDPLHLIVEIKGYRREDAKDKKCTMDTYWIPGVNNSKTYGRWAFAEFTEVYQIESDFKVRLGSKVSSTR
jgi:hypothetical protein